MAVSCTQPGCTGTIEDGYCNVCGLPPDTPGAGPVSARTQAAAGGPGAGRDGNGSVPTGVGRPPGAAVPSGPAGAVATPSTRTGSNRLPSAPIGSRRAATGTRSTRRLGTSSARLRGARLGAGITTVPPAPPVDPRSAVMDNPVVPENRRFCECGNPVGRGRDGQPGRINGYCGKCRRHFDFAPQLHPGDVLGGQYEMVGCLAHGGLGWIYLAFDRNVDDRWVVLKGLLNTGDSEALATAIAERRYLAEVEHPLIVKIYNFVRHDGADYIVMEYVGGHSLKSILKDRMKANGGRYDPIPVDQAIAYIVEILPAFQYLHDKGLLYCDFKPDNIIQCGDAVKLIDLGAVRRFDDDVSPIYGTQGYQAPEVATVGPSVPADIYTIGRTLLVLAMEFRGYQSTYIASLPPVADTPLFQRHDALYRLLLKACALDPADRFQSADELRVQLLGVLREIVAEREVAEGKVAPHSVPSPLFHPPAIAGDTLTWDQLPGLRLDTGDPMATWLAGVSVTDPAARVQVLRAAPQRTAEVRLAEARAALEAGDDGAVDRAIGEILAEDPWEWRAVWLAGLRALAAEDWPAAQQDFNAVYGQVPGELAPKLALAVACERGGEPDLAEVLYLTCARTDSSYAAAAAFGLARIREARGDLNAAVAGLNLVPPVSSSYVEARRRRAGLLARSDDSLLSLSLALDSVAGVGVNQRDRVGLTVDVLRSALRTVEAQGPDSGAGVVIGGVEATEPALRDGLEAAYRELAAMTEDHAERVDLVDAANEHRRWTLT